MTNILVPMAGDGKRFADAGYKISKPAIKTTDIRTGEKIPMVVCATKDLPFVENDGSNLIYVDRDFHKEDGVEDEIKKYYEKATFITINDLTEGQACSCLLAEKYIDNEEPLLIAGCDNGMIFDFSKLEALTKKCDVIAFTYTNCETVLENPNAYGYYSCDSDGKITDISVKKPISENPLDDHAVVATFWFRKGKIFVEAAKMMINENDRINNEFYVDEVIKYVKKLGYDARIFDIDRYIGWGTPRDYENYENTIKYWEEFYNNKGYLGD